MKSTIELSLASIDLKADVDAEKIKKFTSMSIESLYRKAMKLTGDKLNSQFGRFRTETLPKLAKMCIGAPVLIGHNKGSKPIAKIYDGYVENHFVITPFYFPKGRSDADDLAIDIDSRVLSECSISFQFKRATCSLCGGNMMSWSECPHIPGKEYPATKEHSGGVAFYWYDDIIKVLEGSIVYRGAHPDTGFIDLTNHEEWQTIIAQKRATRTLILPGGKIIQKQVEKTTGLSAANWAGVPYQNLPVNTTRAWDASRARTAVKQWATTKGEVNWDKYKRAFVIYDASNREAQQNYKLPIATIISGRLTAIRSGIHAAMAAVNGSRNKPAVPDSVLNTAYNHLAKYYRKMKETPPERR